ncbi:MAG: undecaprenyl-diphosphatase, partial [Gammaproteobacteria bacterium]
MSDTLNTVILGIIEGITEFLPISSTGHLLIAEQWLGE